MEFGRLAPEALVTIDFQLPPESPFNKELFSGALPVSNPLLYVGCAKWGRKEWVGKIYPEHTREANFLDEYVKHFNSIELNATHYQVYSAATISKWAEKAHGKDFRFCPKLPQVISHFSNLVSPQVQRLMNEFLEGILAFRQHLGPIFIQVSEKFSPEKKENLYTFLQSLPTDLQFFLELRHPGWYDDFRIRNELFTNLRKAKVGSVITDTAGRRDCVHMQLPIGKTFVRFVGNHLHPTDFSRLDEWVIRIKSWIEKGVREIYFFMHHPEEKESPELCDYMIQELNKKCGTNLARPEIRSKV